MTGFEKTNSRSLERLKFSHMKVTTLCKTCETSKTIFFFFPISNNSGSLISCGPFGDTSVVSDTSSRDEKLQKHLLDVFFSTVFLKEYYMLILA